MKIGMLFLSLTMKYARKMEKIGEILFGCPQTEKKN